MYWYPAQPRKGEDKSLDKHDKALVPNYLLKGKFGHETYLFSLVGIKKAELSAGGCQLAPRQPGESQLLSLQPRLEAQANVKAKQG